MMHDMLFLFVYLDHPKGAQWKPISSVGKSIGHRLDGPGIIYM